MRKFLISAATTAIICSGVGVAQAATHHTGTYPRYCTMHPTWTGCPKHAPAQQSNPLMPRLHSNPFTNTNICCATALADAHIDWLCALSGGVLGAGITIFFPTASPAWAVLSQALWTYGCSVADTYYLNQNQVSALQNWMYKNGCVAGWYAWNRAGRSSGPRDRWVYKCGVWAV
jgi:hypothetical protein